MIIKSNSTEETRAAGAGVVSKTEPGSVYALVGPLGAGKTEFVRGFMKRLNPASVVRSPSFSLVNTYAAPEFRVHHFDFYRIAKREELAEIGFDEYVWSEDVSLIEWADLFPDVLPPNTKYVKFRDEGGSKRTIEIQE